MKKHTLMKKTHCHDGNTLRKGYLVQSGPKKSFWCDQNKSVWEILKYLLMESFSLYIHIFSSS